MVFCAKIWYNRSMSIHKVSVSNASSRKTRMAIRQAFAALLAEKGALNKITIADLARRAGVTRGTFYTHYDNIYEVALELQNELSATLFKPTGMLRTPADAMEYFAEIFEFLQANETLYRLLLSSDAPLMFINELEQQMSGKIMEIIEQTKELSHEQKAQMTLDALFFIDGAIYLVMKYFRGKLDMSLEEISEYLQGRFKEMFER